MKNIEIYTLDYCPYCQKAKFFLDELNIKYKEYSCEENEEKMRTKLKEKYNLPNLATFPQIIIDGVNIGGYSDLIEKYNSKEISLN
ncbi:MAG: glutathione S-transferase N-terminal domain-containing protein [Candidatus Gastranaerophilales bacterium]|nr:glutathione S-transferase N-terminal domain-containing protein [Candidatus Gastranaerophilales bacterium]